MQSETVATLETKDSEPAAEADPYYDEDLLATEPKPKKMFSYAWSSGYVSPFLPTSNEHLDALIAAIDHLKIFPRISTENEPPTCSFWDIGSGDGVTLIKIASHYNVKCIGIELDASLCDKSRTEASLANVAERIEIRCEDLSNYTKPEDFDPCPTMIFLFLLPTALEKLRPTLEALMRARPEVIVAIEVWSLDLWKDRLFYVENNRFYFYKQPR